MKFSMLVITLFSCGEMLAQTSGSVEKLNYYTQDGGYLIGPIVKVKNNQDLYLEARYNYEDINTFSFYLGKSYSGKSDFTYRVIPMAGGVFGKFRGISLGLNTEFEYRKLFFSADSQYTRSIRNSERTFYFSWSELGYELTDDIFAGAAFQYTYLPHDCSNLMQAGGMAGYVYNSWQISVYGFRPLNDARNFICSIIWEWGK
jgi:hypothetical protein